LSVTAPRVVAAPDSVASARRESPSRPRQKEGEAFDLWARAVSGQREARESAEAAGRAAGPVNLASAQAERRGRAAAREGKERLAQGAACSAGGSGPAPEQGRAGLSGKENEAGRRGKEKATAGNQAYGPKPRKEKEM